MNAKLFYASILDSMGLYDQQRGNSLYQLIRKIVYLLNEDYSKKLLVIDEAGKFTQKMLEYLHELRDDTIDSTGIVLAGPSYFQRNLIKWKNSNKDGMPEIYRRINEWIELDKPVLGEIREICYANYIQDEDIIKMLYKECFNFGELNNRIGKYFKHLEYGGDEKSFNW